MQIAASSYYAAMSRPPCARTVDGQQRLEVIREVHVTNYGVYGVRKMHADLNRRYLVGPPQLADLTLQLSDALRLSGCDTAPVALVNLGLADPVAQGLGIDPELLTHSAQSAAINSSSGDSCFNSPRI